MKTYIDKDTLLEAIGRDRPKDVMKYIAGYPADLTETPEGDAVSREAVCDIIENTPPWERSKDRYLEKVRELPPTAYAPRCGNWVPIDDEPHETFECDNCGFIVEEDEPAKRLPKYCPECGYRMGNPYKTV